MQWVNGETRESKRNRKEKWHKWFAWYPVVIGEINRDGKIKSIKVWVQYIMRQGTRQGTIGYSVWNYQYKIYDEKLMEELNKIIRWSN